MHRDSSMFGIRQIGAAASIPRLMNSHFWPSTVVEKLVSPHASNIRILNVDLCQMILPRCDPPSTEQDRAEAQLEQRRRLADIFCS